MAHHWIGPLISNWAFKLIVSIENAMSHVNSSGVNEMGRRDGEAASLLRSISMVGTVFSWRKHLLQDYRG